MSRAQWEGIKAEGDEVSKSLAALMDKDPAHAEVQALIGRHHAWVEAFYPASAEVYGGLGLLYVEHPEFRAFYDKLRPGLADFLAASTWPTMLRKCWQRGVAGSRRVLSARLHAVPGAPTDAAPRRCPVPTLAAA